MHVLCGLGGVPIWKVLGFARSGDTAPYVGLAMSRAQVKAYVRGSAVCKSFARDGYSVGTIG